MDWSPQQNQALEAVSRWLSSGSAPFFYLAGYAGTGKTTLAKTFAAGLGGNVLYGAFTGKAAYVLRQKGCDGATTIHSLIYKPKEKNREKLTQLRKELEDCEADMKSKGTPESAYPNDAQWKRCHDELELEKLSHRKMMFSLNPESSVKDASLLIIDECSMVDQRIGEDLLSFNTPILVLGDPAQLPPVMGYGYFTSQTPDFLLTEIHRQAKGNPILELAHTVRSGGRLMLGDYGDSRVISTKDVNKDDVMSYDQILVGTNRRRHGTNARMRELLNRAGSMPETGDKLVCLRNNHEAGLLNGGLWNVQEAVNGDETSVDLVLKSDDGKQDCVTSAHSAYFLGKEPPFWDIKERDCFDYGYALTVHKAQGSQWDKVYIFDESRCFRSESRRWLYTAITRAAKQVVVVTD